RDVVDRRDMRHADAGDHPGGADRVVDDDVVRHEAVIRAVDLAVVDGDLDVEIVAAEPLHDLELVEVPLLVRRVQARAIRGAAALVARPDEPARRPGLGVVVREAPAQEEAEQSEQLDKLRGRVVEAQAPARLAVTVALRQPVEETLEVEWVPADVPARQVLFLTLPELGEEAGPLQRVEEDLERA